MKYKNLLFENTNQPATNAEIASIENELGEKLPEDYKSFLKSCNGGNLEYDIQIIFEDESTEYLSFSSLYTASSGNHWECNPYELRQSRNQEGFPQSGILPIARDGGSSILYLDLRDGYKVVAFVQGLPEWTGLRQNNSLLVIANSFDEYIDKLTISDEMLEDHIENFEITEESVNSTIEWFDSIGPKWREKFRALWNGKVPFKKV